MSVTTTYDGPISLTINGGTFTGTQGDALYLGKIAPDTGKTNHVTNVKLLKVLGGTFTGASGMDGLKVVKDNTVDPFTSDAVKQITGGKYSTAPDSTYLLAGYTSTQDGTYYVVAKAVPQASAVVTKDTTTGVVTKMDTGNSQTIEKTQEIPSNERVVLELQSNGATTGDKIELTLVTGKTLSVDAQGVVAGEIAAAVIKPQEIVNANGQKTKLELTTTDIEKVFGGRLYTGDHQRKHPTWEQQSRRTS
ncbi:MAG: hypothetical protein MJ014_00645 [Methanocorpusculum sp.]|nr:hypothetical protein [Methanocorpusculum sp.]